jgi:tetratricopeptide (TPR) repeat protein
MLGLGCMGNRNLRFNFRFFLILLVGTAVLIGGIHLLNDFQTRRTAAALWQRADEAERRGDLDETVRLLLDYLAFDPHNTDALARYGLLRESQAVTRQERADVLQIFERVLARDPKRDPVRLKAARIALELRLYSTARSHLDRLGEPEAGDGTIHDLRGQLAEAEGKYSLAAEHFEKAIRQPGCSLSTWVRLARVVGGPLQDPGRATQIMDEMVASQGELPQALLERSQYRAAHGIPGSEADLARAYELAPDNPDAILGMARSAQARGELENARRLLLRGVALDPRAESMYLALAALEGVEGKLEEAISWLRQGIDQLPSSSDLKVRCAELLIQTGRVSEAEQTLEAVRQSGDLVPGVVDLIEGQVRVAQGRWTEALGALKRVEGGLSELPQAARRPLRLQAELLIARCHGERSEPWRELEAFERALELDPASLPARLGRARALEALGRTDAALEAFASLVEEAPRAAIDVARLMVARTSALSEPRRRWKETEEALRTAERLHPKAQEVPLLRASMLAAQGRIDGARQILEEARAHHPEVLGLWIALALLPGSDADPEAGMAVLDQAENRFGDRVELRLVRASLAARRAGEVARGVLEGLQSGMGRFSLGDRVVLLQGLADAYRLIGHAAEAQRLRRQAAQLSPENLKVQLQWFDDASLAEDDEGMEQAIAAIRRLEGANGSAAHWCEASRLVSSVRRGKEPKAALIRARRLLEGEELSNPSPRGSLLLAEIAIQLREPDQAIEQLRQAIRRGERRATTYLQLVQLLRSQKRDLEADLVIRELPAEVPPTGSLARQAAELAIRTGDFARAEGLARQVVSADSDDPRDQLWLGEILLAAGQPAAAEAAFRKALKRSHELPEAWVALTRLLVRQDRANEVDRLISEARHALPPECRPLTVARCLELAGRIDEAAVAFQDALASGSKDSATIRDCVAFYQRAGKFEQAEALLRGLLDPTRQVSLEPSDRAEFRRSLALILARDGLYPRIQEAWRLLEENRAEGWQEVADRRAEAIVLAAQPNRRREALRALEELARMEPLAPEELLLLAGHALAEGEWSKAWEAFSDLLRAQPANPRYLAAFARALLAQGDLSQAKRLIDRLGQTHPSSLVAAELQAKYLSATEQSAEATALLRQHAERSPEDRSAVARIFEELNQFEDAETQYRRLVENHPDRVEPLLELAGFLSRRGNRGAALQICQDVLDRGHPETVITTAVSVLYRGHASDDDVRRVEQWTLQAIRNHPELMSLRFNLANLYTLQERYEDAERIYRSLLKHESGLVATYNNLAWILSLQRDRLHEALEIANQAVSLLGTHPSLLDTRATVLLSLGKTEEAVRDLTEALALSPSPTLYLHLAQAKLQAADLEASRRAFENAKRLGLNIEKLPPRELSLYRQLEDRLAPVTQEKGGP